MRRAANRLRITGQLVEGTRATHVWADKFEGAVEDVFDLQDRLTESIVGAIEPSMRRAEIERARRKRPDRLDAYDLYLRALPHAYANTPADTDEALRLLNEALRLDPNYAAAHGHAAWCHEQRFLRGGFHPEDRAAALKHAGVALGIGTDDPQALCIGAFVHANITHDYESAIGALDRALEMNGNSALAFGFSALVHTFCERYERATDHALKALAPQPVRSIELPPLSGAWRGSTCSPAASRKPSPIRPWQSRPIPASACFTPTSWRAMSISTASMRRARQPQRLLEIAPGFTVSGFVRMDLVRPALMEAFATALRQAGLPE